MINKNILIKNKNFLKKAFIIATLTLLILFTVSSVSGHILLIGNTEDSSTENQEALDIYQKLIDDGYPVLFLIGENATRENIVKGMYNADALIYVGFGKDIGYYLNEWGSLNPNYDIYDIYGTGLFESESYLPEKLTFNKEFIPPLKKNASAIFLHISFAGGFQNVSASFEENLYAFCRPYVNAEANIYSSGYYQIYSGGYFDGVLGQELNNGGEKSLTFKEANNLASYFDKIYTSSYTEFNGIKYFSSSDYGSIFIGDLNSYVLPPSSECSEYDPTAANNWYNSNKAKI